MNRGRFPRLLAAALLVSVVPALARPARADEGAPPPPLQRTLTLNDYRQQVSTILPSFDASMLSVPAGPNWMAGKTVHDVAMATGDTDPDTSATSGPVTIGFDLPNGPRYIKLDFDRGYIRYSNRDRAFSTGVPCGAVPVSVAQNAFMTAMNMLGVPTTERGTLVVDTAAERVVNGESPTPMETPCEIERMVTGTRRLSNGFEVFDCWARLSVSNFGQDARMSIQWPRFQLTSGLSMRSRAEVIDDIARQIWVAESDTSGLGAQVEVNISLGYLRTPRGFMPVARTGFSENVDGYAGQIEYIPLVLSATSVEPEERRSEVELRSLLNPGAGIAILEFYLPEPEVVQLTLVDATGRAVIDLAHGPYGEGWHRLEWNLSGRDGRSVAPGIYFAKLEAGTAIATRKIVVVK